MEWRFGIARTQEGARDIRIPFDALCLAASELTGITFRPHFAATYGELVEGLREGEIGMAWLPPIPALDVIDGRLATPLAIPARQGATTYLAALIVRQRGPRSLDELRGRRVAWVQKESAAGYLVPRMHLAAEGFEPNGFFSREVFVHNHGAVVDAVVNGDADVGATYCRTDAHGTPISGAWINESGQATRPVEVLATVGPIPNDALFVSPDIPAAARASLVRWLLTIDREAQTRALWQRVLDAGDFRMPASDHFDALRHLLRTANARGAR